MTQRCRCLLGCFARIGSPLFVGVSIAVAVVLVAASGGCGSNNTVVAASKLLNPVEKEFGPPLVTTTPNPDDNTKSDAFSAHLYLKIDKSDETVFDATYAAHKNEAREKVTAVLLQATPQERQDPTLDAIKQRIREAVNTLLEAEFVKDVIATDVSAITYQN